MNRSHQNRYLTIAVAAGFVSSLFLLSGCAGRKKTHQEFKRQENRIEQLEEHAEGTDEHFKKVEKKLSEFSDTAREALERAKELGEANDLVEEVVLREDLAQFHSGSSTLSDRAKSYLNEFAGNLIEKNQLVYIEIQGHTDSMGAKAANKKLGLHRAEAVYEYLGKEAGIPLHRMRTISYGEEKPVADNSTSEGRAQNRRVVLVVLR